ncbi:MAG TPA: ATP-binding protein [Candidatus Baltobacteraceae bacterium]|nr:ATP-binding protein [Candidatus Baltobacteraceae bacterium]
MDLPETIGYVDGSVESTTQRFEVVLNDDTLVQLDDLVVSRQDLPGDRGTLAHYGIVVEGTGMIEGARMASDTKRIYATQTMPGQRINTVTVQILRTDPELWMPPQPGAKVELARDAHRAIALFQDRMEGNQLRLGLDHANEPVSIDWTFLNGEKGAHISVSGISGVATKTSYALFVLYMLLETAEGRALLGRYVADTKAVVFNVKGEDLLHIDRPNSKFADDANAAAMWQALGVNQPAPFQNVGIFVPPARGGVDIVAASVAHRRDDEYTVYGWTPLEFVKRGLLQFAFSDAREQNQISFVVDHMRSTLVRHSVPSAHTPGAVIIRTTPAHAGRDFERAAMQLSSSHPEEAAGDPEVKDFADLVDVLIQKIETEDPLWVPRTAQGTNEAFLRRLVAMSKRLGHLVTVHAAPLTLGNNVNVVDIHALHDDAQRFVVGAVLDQIWQEKQARGRQPLRFVVLDELNKYAPREGRSPIKEILVDIAARGRSLGVILIGCQQNASRVEAAIVDNAAIKVVGRLDASHADEYKFLSPELRARATRFLPGTMVLDQPVVPAPIPIVFPFPPYATNVTEDAIGATATRDGVDPVDKVLA